MKHLLSLLASTVVAGVLVSSASASSFIDSFDAPRSIEEAPSPGSSPDAEWWVNSGAWLRSAEGRATTVQGALPSGDPWRSRYAASNPLDTDDGTLPQNLFRLVTRRHWTDAEQEVWFRITRTNLTGTPNRGGWSGILLFQRYVDGDNLYYAGLRHDGAAVIKRKRAGQYTTLAQASVYPGSYDSWSRPNLLPQGTWIGLRTEIRDLDGGGVLLRVLVKDPSFAADWVPVLEAEDTAPIREAGSFGIRIDYMDVELDDFAVREPGSSQPETEDGPIGRTAAPAVFDGGVWKVDADLDGILELEKTYGRSGDVPVAADYDGDGATDLAIFRPSYGGWFIDTNRNGGTDRSFLLGARGDVPVPADYDGDGAADAAIFRPSEGAWWIDLGADGIVDRSIVYGRAGDVPVPADYDGDGAADLAIFRPSYGGWFIDTNRNGGTDRSLLLGVRGDVPVPADYDGDGAADPAVFGTLDGIWQIDLGGDRVVDRTLAYGRGTDLPVPADYDGDGIADLGVHRSSWGGWYVDTDRNGGTDLHGVLSGGTVAPIVRW